MEEIGDRIYEIRRALGPNARKAMPQREFAELLNRHPDAGGRYDASVVSRLETGQQRATLDDVAVIADADPQKRGRLWLGWGAPVADVGKNGDAVTLRPDVTPDPFRATGTVVPHEAYREATTPTAAELEAQEREGARRRRPGATGRKRRA